MFQLTDTLWASVAPQTWGSINYPWITASLIMDIVNSTPSGGGIPRLARTLTKKQKEEVIKIKFKMKGYTDEQIEKTIKNKTIKITVKDLTFIKNQIFINNVHLNQ
jgi:hypothetical protein